MKGKIVGLMLAVLMVCLALPGCSVSQIDELESQVTTLQAEKAAVEAERDRLDSNLTERITELSDKDGQLERKDIEISKLEEKKVELQAEVECLKEPTPTDFKAKIVGYIGFDETVKVGKELFTRVGASSFIGKGPYPLVSLETLEKFLDNDRTNSCPSCYQNPYSAGDEWAFRLKDRWIRANLPSWSLGLLKMEMDTMYYGKILVWRNIFLTKEDGEFVFYEVNPCTDKIIRIDEPSEIYKIVMFLGKL